MTYNLGWYKAISVSCAVHLLIVLLLTVLIGRADIRQLPERYIAIELTEISASNGQVIETAHADKGSAQAISEMSSGKQTVTHPVAEARTVQTITVDGNTVAAVPAGGIAGTADSGAQRAAGLHPAAASGVKAANIDSIVNAFLLQIERRKNYPYMARRMGQEGTVTVAVRLTATGELAAAQVINSSGVAVLDEAALSLVRKVCPFAHNAGRTLAMHIPIAYYLE